jgi:hypothetical protein
MIDQNRSWVLIGPDAAWVCGISQGWRSLESDLESIVERANLRTRCRLPTPSPSYLLQAHLGAVR